MKYCIFLALAALPALAADSVRMGNLVVTLKGLSATRDLPNPGGGPIKPLQGKHFIVARFHLKNAGPNPNCTNFTAELRSDFGERIQPYLTGQSWEATLDGLAPGKVIDGDYAFEVKDDARRYKLVFIVNPNSQFDSSCRLRPDPPPRVDVKTAEIILHEPVEVSLNSQEDKPGVFCSASCHFDHPGPGAEHSGSEYSSAEDTTWWRGGRLLFYYPVKIKPRSFIVGLSVVVGERLLTNA